jgi:hypothetical protein
MGSVIGPSVSRYSRFRTGVDRSPGCSATVDATAPTGASVDARSNPAQSNVTPLSCLIPVP